jgi:glutamate/tyrosine decarboxylase-like PLP-dependent enzyme
MSELEPRPGVGKEQSLDPENWAAFRSLAHRMVDDMVDHLSSLSEQPAWRQVPAEVEKLLLAEPVPVVGQGEEVVYREFMELVLPYPSGNLHPRFYGWVQGNGIPYANMADLLASAMNPHLAGYWQAPAMVERKVIAWLAELIGFPEGTSGVLESGGTMANVLGLAVARQNRAGFDVRVNGLQQVASPLTVYCSVETHGWIQKGVEMLGIGTHWLRKIPVDADFRMDLEVLAATVDQDLKDGLRPICVVGTAGTVNTGAIDDLEAIADFCQARGLWFHVDGAFGAMAKLSPSLADLVKGVERADSLAVDLHKWMYLPFEIACFLVRDPTAHVATFAFAPSYLASLGRGVTAGGFPFADRGIDLTRNFKALKAWMCVKAYGIEAFAKLIDQNMAQVRHLVDLIAADPRLELLAPVPLNVVCFRYAATTLNETELDALNIEILLRLQETGAVILSSTQIHGKFALRFCNVNHRSKWEDIDFVVAEILRHGKNISEEMTSPEP